MANRIREWRERRGKSLDDLADAIGISTGYLSRLETGGRNVSLKYLPRIAAELAVKESDLVTNADDPPIRTSVMGYANAGGDTITFADGQGPFDDVEAPSWATEKTVAVRIRGTSLGRLLDGWLAFYDDRKDPPDESIVGFMCVCGLADGRVVIKKLRAGSSKGLYHLESETEATLFDQRVDWAAQVKELRPR